MTTPAPESWETVSLRDLGDWQGGGTPSKAVLAYWNGSIPWVSPKDMKTDSIADAEDHITEEAIDRSATSLVPGGSVLMVTRSGILAHSFPVAVTKTSVALNQDLKALIPHQGIDGEFIAWALRRYSQDILAGCSKHGTTVHSIETPRLKQFEIPVAPTAEQRRIIEKIDELFSQIEAGEQALQRAQKLLERYRQSVLNAAVTGDLTRDWRHRNPNSGDGSQALARAGAARRSLVAAASAKLPAARAVNPSYLWDVPPTWTWCAVDEAGDVQLGQQRAPQHHRGKHMRPYLRVANVLEDRLDLRDVKEMNFEPHELSKFELETGDILLNEGQSPELLGRSAVYNGEVAGCCIQKTLLRFRAYEGIIPQFAQIVFRHYMHSGRFRRIARITTNIGHLTRVRFVEMEFPVPPTSEQEEIVNRFETIDTNIKHLSRDIAGSLTVQLRQSILAAAFSGKLVQQDPADEPASVLLGRIAAERKATDRPTPGRARRGERAGEQLELFG